MGNNVDTLLGIAANPAAPPEVRARLASLPGAGAAIAGRADLDPGHAHRLHQTGDVHTAIQLAANRHAPTELREQLAEHSHAYVREAVGRTGHVAERVLVRLALDHEQRVRLGVARGAHNTPLTHKALLADDDGEVRRAVIARAELPEELTDTLLADPDGETREALADNPHISPETVKALTDDPSPLVRAKVMLRHDVGEDVRARLYSELSARPTDPDDLDALTASVQLDGALAGDAPWVRRELVETQIAFLRSPYPFLRRAVARNPKIPARVASNLLTDADTWVRQFAAGHPSTRADVLVAFTREFDGTGKVRHDYVRHPNFPASALPRLATDDQPRLRLIALDSPALPSASVLWLLADADPLIAHKAARHPSLPLGAMLDLLTAAGR
ncbi:hypothetical protein AB0I28_34150 [Phytomonospora sp. NPDC050363]|uniref:hypothetical protein n=1 Tax=Phytomonospora sp. NPDC050363 TaxID=3155642 RepID=UPI0033FD0FA0